MGDTLIAGIQDTSNLATKTELNTGLSVKANTDADNFSTTGKSTIVGWGTPDYSAAITISALPFTAPKDGLFVLQCRVANGRVIVKVNNNTPYHTIANSSGTLLGIIRIPLSKNDVVSSVVTSSATVPYSYGDGDGSFFAPFKGV